MSEWWTYRPSDFLMFAPRTWWRLFELHNTAWWPLPAVGMAAGLAWLVWAWRCGAAAWRPGAAGAALACAFVALAFMGPRYAPINWAASGFAVGWLVLAAGLALLAFTPAGPGPTGGAGRPAGALLCAWALLGHPLLAPGFGRPWAQAEVFLMAPDPTALAVLGLLWLLPPGEGRVARSLRRLAAALALAWCAISTATLATMGEPQAAVVAGAALLAVATAWVDRRRCAAGPSGRHQPDAHGEGGIG